MKAMRYLPLLLLVISSCRQPRELVYKEITNVSVNQSTVSVNVKMYNPNNYSLKFRHADLDVLLNGNSLGKMTTDKVIRVARRDTFILPVTLAVDLKKVLPNAVQLLFNSEVSLQITGKIKAGRHGLYINVPVNYEGKYDLKNLLGQ